MYPEVSNHERIRIRILYSWKDEKHRGSTGNKFYLIKTFRLRTPSLFISYSTIQEKGCLKIIIQSFTA